VIRGDGGAGDDDNVNILGRSPG